MVCFNRVKPEEVDFLGGQSIEYLQEAALSIKHYLGAADAIQQTKLGIGHIYQVFSEKELLGCFFVNFVENHLGRVMNMVLLGGKDILKWGSDLSQFLYKLADEEKVDEFCYLGREGFSKIFPNLEKVAVLYRVGR